MSKLVGRRTLGSEVIPPQTYNYAALNSFALQLNPIADLKDDEGSSRQGEEPNQMMDAEAIRE